MKHKNKEPILSFESAKKWEQWLAKFHTKHPGLWLRIYKKASGKPTVSYAEAVDAALCYGWIDSQKDSYDDQSWLQRFTPRRLKSVWSKTNTLHIERLIKENRMKAAGLKHVEMA
jgi:uncharacterized protein YdeI (YjbR/CyaY-like superfamily)